MSRRASVPRKTCLTAYLGTVTYARALELQEKLARDRVDGNMPDALLLLQHPPVFTTGRFRGEEDIIVPTATLAEKGITVVNTNRGGSVTYHGPGQLVGYPILSLRELDLDIHRYIWNLEESVIRLLKTYGIEGSRIEEYTGVWVGDKKICSIGIHVSHWITTHGFALNINTDLSHFGLINPCGLKSEVMTSLSVLLGRNVEVEQVLETFLDCFSRVFKMDCARKDEQWTAITANLNG